MRKSKVTPKNRYLVEYGLPDSIRGCNTIEALQRYLIKDPHPDYRLVSCTWNDGTYSLVWELLDK